MTRPTTIIALMSLVGACGQPPKDALPPLPKAAPSSPPQVQAADPAPSTSAAPGPRRADGDPAELAPERLPQGPATPGQRYPATRTLSPFTPSVAANIQAIAGRGISLRESAFMKVGASGSAVPWLLGCLAGPDIVLGDFTSLRSTLDAFRSSPAAPLSRKSLAAQPGQTARWAISGSPSPVEREIAAVQPRFALVHYGTNDMHMAGTFSGALHPFARNLLALVDGLMEQGVIPSLGTLAPRLDREDANFWVPTYNQVVRAIAQWRSVPLLDLHTAMLALPNRGRARDKLHANVLRDGGKARPCVFTDRGLSFAYNVRNYLSLRVLDQLRRIVQRRPYDREQGDPPLVGRGDPADPVVIDGVPFADMRDIRRSRSVALNRLRCGTSGAMRRTGPEVVYRLTLARERRLRVVAVNFAGTDVDLYILPARDDGCLAFSSQVLAGRFPAGEVRIAVDTRLIDERPRWGEYALAIVECDAADRRCDLPAW